MRPVRLVDDERNAEWLDGGMRAREGEGMRARGRGHIMRREAEREGIKHKCNKGVWHSARLANDVGVRGQVAMGR